MLHPVVTCTSAAFRVVCVGLFHLQKCQSCGAKAKRNDNASNGTHQDNHNASNATPKVYCPCVDGDKDISTRIRIIRSNSDSRIRTYGHWIMIPIFKPTKLYRLCIICFCLLLVLFYVLLAVLLFFDFSISLPLSGTLILNCSAALPFLLRSCAISSVFLFHFFLHIVLHYFFVSSLYLKFIRTYNYRHN